MILSENKKRLIAIVFSVLVYIITLTISFECGVAYGLTYVFLTCSKLGNNLFDKFYYKYMSVEDKC